MALNLKLSIHFKDTKSIIFTVYPVFGCFSRENTFSVSKNLMFRISFPHNAFKYVDFLPDDGTLIF